MLAASRRIVRYTEGATIEDVLSNEILMDALVRQFTVLGEAATRISPPLRAQNPDIPWQRIIGMRNVVVHQYDKVLIKTMWDAVTDDVPGLVARLEVLLPPEPDDT
ncbi:MAG TPA: DUF86 domain-containing protein [Longimicrobiaceae bacterium]|nr:DUF86 domain-containing protein [Longimicrobiaceae bacterium]